MRFLILLFGFTILFQLPVFSQNTEKKTWVARLFHDYFPFDSSYVSSFPTKPLVKAFVNNKSHDFFIRTSTANTVHFKPGRANGYGFGFVYHQIALELSFTPPVKFDINQRNPNGRIDINSTLFNNRFGIDFLFQNYRGYIMANPERVLNNWPGSQQFIRDDLVSTYVGLNFFYVQNAKKFSLRSAFVGDQIQHKSAGSVLYGAYINTLNIQGKTSIVPDSSQITNSDIDGIRRIGNASLGFMLGFGYNYVIHKGFFVSLVGIPGMGVALGSKSNKGYFSSGPELNPQVMLNARISTGYNGKQWSTILQWSENLGAYEFGSESRVSVNQSKLKLTLGYRFQKPLRYRNKLL